MRSWMRQVMQAVRAVVSGQRPAVPQVEAMALLAALRQAQPGQVVPLPDSLALEPLLVAQLSRQAQAERLAMLPQAVPQTSTGCPRNTA